MASRTSVIRSITLLAAMAQSAISATVPASFSTASSVPLNVPAYSAVGQEIALSLNFAPQVGCNLTAVNVTGLDFIEGRFSNLAQGQEVQLEHGGQVYQFAANYYGGSGNDLVLHWSAQALAVWGENRNGELGNGKTARALAPVGNASLPSALLGRTVVAIASGETHSLALCSDGTLAAWGQNGYGQLGNGDETASEIPSLVDRSGVLAGRTVVSIVAGADHNLVLCSDGTLVAWGSNYGRELGKPGYPYPIARVPIQVDQTGVLAGKTVVKIAAAETHCLVLCSDGTVVSWGSGPPRQGLNGPGLVDQSGVLAGRTVVSISAGRVMDLAVCSDGTVASWGQNYYGELGNGTSGIGLVSDVPVLVKQDGVLAGKQVVAAAAGGLHALALCSDGTLAAWGYNSHGTLGNGSNISSNVPVAVDQTGILTGREVISVRASRYGSLAICSDGSLAEWGDGLKNPVSAGHGILEGKAVVSVTFGRSALALCSDGTLGVWGGAGGLPTAPDFKPPVLIGKTVVSLVAGNSHSLALCADGTLAAWGDGSYGQLGTGGYPWWLRINHINGRGILAGKSVVAVAAGAYHSLALCSDGTIAAWGVNSQGQLGDGSTSDRFLPVAVDLAGPIAGKKVVALAAGYAFSLALCSDGTVFAWGSNYGGKLGDGTTADRHTPVAVDRSGVLAGKSVVQISSKSAHSLALCADGNLVAWGFGQSGLLGNGANLDSKVPVSVDQTGVLAGKSIVVIKTLGESSLVLCSDGTMAAWGRNGEGQLGDGSSIGKNSPALVNQSGVLAGKTVVDLAAGSYHSIAICADSTLAGWGSNTTGQLGDGNPLAPAVSNLPVLVDRTGFLSGKKVLSVSAGSNHNLAIVALSPLPLRNITTSAGAFTFDPTVTSYSISVANEVASLTITPTFASAASDVTIQGVPVASDVAGSAIPLTVGTNPIAIQVTSPNGLATTYSIQVVRRTPPSDPTLAALGIDYGILSPAFSPQSVVYDAEVPSEVSIVRILPTPSNSKAVILLNEIPIAPSVVGTSVSLIGGSNEFRIKMIAEDGIHDLTYILRITRRPPDLATLKTSGVPLTPIFSTLVTSYQMKVLNKITSIKITPTCSDITAILTVNGVSVIPGAASRAIALAVGTNVISVTVADSAQLTIKSYKVRITRAKSSDATLSGLSAFKAVLSPSFKPRTNTYSAKVPNTTQSVRIKAMATAKEATIKVNGTRVKSGVATQPIPLGVGRNTILVKVSAQDGTFNIYKITLTRAPSSSASNLLQPALAASGSLDRPVVSKVSSGGRSYLQVTTAKRHDGSKPLVEVSSDLVNWSSGDRHTRIMVDDRQVIRVCDSTPYSPAAKRFIRLRWLAP